MSRFELRGPADRPEWRAAEGQTLIEYALILVLVAVVVFAAVTFLGGDISSLFNQVSNDL